jgi:hypothetical protein
MYGRIGGVGVMRLAKNPKLSVVRHPVFDITPRYDFGVYAPVALT